MTKTSGFIYPANVIVPLRQAWRKSRWRREELPDLPNDETLTQFLEVAYHASMQVEEGRASTFRLALISFKDAQAEVAGREAFSPVARPVAFNEPRSFSVQEIRRLAPATDFSHMLIGVGPNTSQGKTRKGLAIWGLIDAGSEWSQFLRGESHGAYPPPYCLTAASTHPGTLFLSRQGEVLFALRSGRITTRHLSPFNSGPVFERLASAHTEFYSTIVRRLTRDQYSVSDDDYPIRFYNTLIERLATRVGDHRHGGTIVIVPDELSHLDSRLADRLVVKYPCDDRRIWRLGIDAIVFHDGYHKNWNRLWKAKKPFTAKEFQQFHHFEKEREETDAALNDAIGFVAALSGVDGAVVITDRLRLVGFGAEFRAESRTLESVRIARNEAGDGSERASIDAFGTRHRSAFRFCSSYEAGIAIIVSQDGAARVVKRVGADVVLWPEVNWDDVSM